MFYFICFDRGDLVNSLISMTPVHTVRTTIHGSSLPDPSTVMYQAFLKHRGGQKVGRHDGQDPEQDALDLIDGIDPGIQEVTQAPDAEGDAEDGDEGLGRHEEIRHPDVERR